MNIAPSVESTNLIIHLQHLYPTDVHLENQTQVQPNNLQQQQNHVQQCIPYKGNKINDQSINELLDLTDYICQNDLSYMN